MRRTILLLAVVSVLGGLLVGCGGNDGFPMSAYVSTANVNGLGPITVTYKDGGTLTVEQGGSKVSDGTYTVEGDKITLGDSYCKEQGAETATYTWNWDGSQLTMTTANDGCESRKAAVAQMAPVG